MKAGLPAFLATKGGLRGFGRTCLRDGVPQPSTQSVCITPSRDYLTCVAVFNLIRTHRVGKRAETKITGAAYGGCDNNELSPFKILGLVHLQRGGSSPFSRKFRYQNRAASTPCDLLANLRSSTCESIQAKSSGVTVTLILGLLSEAISSKILPMRINMGGEHYTSILLLSSMEGVPNEIRTCSGRYRRLEECKIEGGC